MYVQSGWGGKDGSESMPVSWQAACPLQEYLFVYMLVGRLPSNIERSFPAASFPICGTPYLHRALVVVPVTPVGSLVPFPSIPSRGWALNYPSALAPF